MKLQVKSYSNLISELQSTLNLTQAELALKLGISYPSLSRWRNGHHQPSPMAIALLKQAVVNLGDRGKDLHQYF
jgi:DNA-binding transcriptional regulator YiaG